MPRSAWIPLVSAALACEPPSSTLESSQSALSGAPQAVSAPFADRSPGVKGSVMGGVTASGAVAAWTDQRKPGVVSVVATRVASATGSLDPIGIDLGTGSVSGLAAGASTVLIAVAQPAGVNAFRVHPQTGLVSATPTYVPGASFGPLAWNGSSWWITWPEFGVVRGVRIDADGGRLDAAPLIIRDAGVNELRAAPHPVGTDSLFASFEPPGNTVKAWWLRADGGLTSAGVMQLGTGAVGGSLELATSSTTGLVTWLVSDGGAGNWLTGARTTPTSLVDAFPVSLMPSNPVYGTSMTLGHDGQQFRLAFTGTGAQLPHEARLSPSLAQAAVVTPLAFYRGDGDAWAIDQQPGTPAWLFDHLHGFLSYYPVRASRLDLDGGLAPAPNAFIISRGYSGQRHPVVVAMGSSWLAAWQELRFDSYATVATVLDGAGAPSRASLELDRPFAFSSWTPKVAASASSGWVAWVNNSGFRAVLFPADGGAATSLSVPLNTTFTDAFGVAFDGQRYAVAWSSSNQVFFRRFSETGVPFDTASITVDTVGPSYRDVDVTYGGSTYLVTWSTYGSTFASRISSAGVLLDATPVRLGSPGETVKARFSRNGFDVVWGENDNPFTSAVQVSRLELDGGGVTFAVLTDGGCHAPGIGATAAGSWLALHSRFADGGAGTVLGRWLADGGMPWQAAPLASDSAAFGFGSAVAGNAAGDVLVAYTHYEPAIASTQIWAQVLSPLPSGAVCSADFDCGSAWCLAGRCGVPGSDAGSPDAGPLDAGTPDAGTPDGGPPDAGPPDAGTPDAGPPDAGTPDAGTPDAGTPDAGTPDGGPPDAGPPDAGTPDAGTPDAGTPDAGTPDAGTPERDAGQPDAGTVPHALGVGCRCDGAPALGVLGALGARLLRRRRRP